MDHCATCGSSKSLKACSGCNSTMYCSVDCQRKDWKHHSGICKQLDIEKDNSRNLQAYIEYLEQELEIERENNRNMRANMMETDSE